MSNWFDTAFSQMTVTTTLDSDKVKAIGDLQRNSLSEIEGRGAGEALRGQGERKCNQQLQITLPGSLATRSRREIKDKGENKGGPDRICAFGVSYCFDFILKTNETTLCCPRFL